MVTVPACPAAAPLMVNALCFVMCPLSCDYGAGGSELGVLLGAELGWPVLDRDLAHKIAARLRCKHTDVEALDEHAPTWLERIATVFTVAPSDAPILPEPPSTPDPDELVEAA